MEKFAVGLCKTLFKVCKTRARWELGRFGIKWAAVLFRADIVDGAHNPRNPKGTLRMQRPLELQLTASVFGSLRSFAR